MVRNLILVIFVALSSWAEAAVDSSSYLSNLELREKRKVGVGTDFGGASGIMGLHLELNIEDQDGARVQFGLGEAFSTFALAWKHSFVGEGMAPYVVAGWSRWYNSSGSGSPRSYLLDDLLSAEEKTSSRFSVDFLVAGAGYQFHQLEGDWIGASFFFEASVMAAPFRSQILPAAALGMTYYF